MTSYYQHFLHRSASHILPQQKDWSHPTIFSTTASILVSLNFSRRLTLLSLNLSIKNSFTSVGLNTIVIPLYLQSHKKSRLCHQTLTIVNLKILKWKQTNWPKKLFIFLSAYHHHLFRFRHKARRVSSAVLKQKVGAFIIRVLYHQIYIHVPCPFRAVGSSYEVWSELLPVFPFSWVSSPHFHIAFYGDYVKHFMEITDKLLKHAAWNGLISHFTGCHTKLDSVFSRSCTSTLTYLDTFQIKAACIPALQMARRTHLCLQALAHNSILRHTSSVLASVETQTNSLSPKAWHFLATVFFLQK